jgi:hypothetical protein
MGEVARPVGPAFDSNVTPGVEASPGAFEAPHGLVRLFEQDLDSMGLGVELGRESLREFLGIGGVRLDLGAGVGLLADCLEASPGIGGLGWLLGAADERAEHEPREHRDADEHHRGRSP